MQQRTIITPRPLEYCLGGIYWLFYLLISQLIPMVVLALTGVNFLSGDGYFFLVFGKFTLDFVGTVLIFQNFLRRSWTQVRPSTFPLALRTYAIYYGIAFVIMLLMQLLPPSDNANQEMIDSMSGSHPVLMTLCVVIYAPLTEECLFRGVLYGPFVKKHPMWGAVLSASLFSLMHVIASIGTVPLYGLLLLFVQYLPAGFCLCYMYRRTGTIWGCIFLHMLVNTMSVIGSFFV